MSETSGEEQRLWKGSPSQWLNFGAFFWLLLFLAGIIAGGIFFPLVWIGAVLPLFLMFWNYLSIKTQVFELTTERLRIFRGVFNQHIDEIELYRIKDYQLFRTWWMRLTGLAAVQLTTSDRSLPELTIPAIRGGAEMRELLRKHVEIQRDKKHVRETDFEIEQPPN